MLNNKRKILFSTLIYVYKFYFLREMSIFLNENLFSCYLLNLTF